MCVVKGPAQGAMAKTKGEKKRRKNAFLSAEDEKAPAERKNTPPPFRSLEENHALRPLEEDHALRSSEEESSRLSGSSEEGVLDTTLSAQSKEQAPADAVSSSAKVEEDKQVVSVTVMSKDDETTTVLTALGSKPLLQTVQQKPDDSVKQPDVDDVREMIKMRQQARLRPTSVHEDKKDDGHVDVGYDPESSEEDGVPALGVQAPMGPALREEQLPLEHSALSDAQSIEQPALNIEPTTALDWSRAIVAS